MDEDTHGECPLCEQKFPKDTLEVHVNMCLFLREAGGSAKSPASTTPNGGKRKVFSIFGAPKRIKQEELKGQGDTEIVINSDSDPESPPDDKKSNGGDKPKIQDVRKSLTKAKPDDSRPVLATNIPLAERMRPDSLDNYIGQEHIMSKNATLRQVIDKHEIPSMILWGPPGCGKVSQVDLKLGSLLIIVSFFSRPPWPMSSRTVARPHRIFAS